MRKFLSIILGVLGAILLVELIIFQATLPEASPGIRYQSEDGFVCTVPDWSSTLEEKDGWHKHVFTGSGQLYVSTRKLDGDPEEWMDHYRKAYICPTFETGIRVFENGRFFLSTFGKAGRKYIYLFSVDDLFFWVEMISNGSTLSSFKEMLDETVSSISVGGRHPVDDFSARAREIDSEILKYVQPPEYLLGMMLGFPLILVMIASLPTAVFAGKLPDLKGRRPVRWAENQFAWIKTRMRFTGTLVSLALFEESLEVFSWKKVRLVVTPADGVIQRAPGRDRLILKRDGTIVVVDVERPAWWLGELSARGFAVSLQ